MVDSYWNRCEVCRNLWPSNSPNNYAHDKELPDCPKCGSSLVYMVRHSPFNGWSYEKDMGCWANQEG